MEKGYNIRMYIYLRKNLCTCDIYSINVSFCISIRALVISAVDSVMQDEIIFHDILR